MKFKQALGDVLIVQHFDSSVAAELAHKTLYIPEDAVERATGGIKARVYGIGTKFRFLNEIKIGDVVIVPKQLGTRIPKQHPSEPQYIVYDGEDVLAKVT